MIEWVKHAIEYLALAVELAAALVIGIAALQTILRLAPMFLRHADPHDEKMEVRLALGRWLAVALELTLAADILKTAISPTWDEIGKLSAIAVLRTGLNYFLEREISRER